MWCFQFVLVDPWAPLPSRETPGYIFGYISGILLGILPGGRWHCVYSESHNSINLLVSLQTKPSRSNPNQLYPNKINHDPFCAQRTASTPNQLHPNITNQIRTNILSKRASMTEKGNGWFEGFWCLPCICFQLLETKAKTMCVCVCFKGCIFVLGPVFLSLRLPNKYGENMFWGTFV